MLLAAVGLVPIALAVVFRVSGVFLFMSVAAGYLLVLYVGDDAGLALGMAVRTSSVDIIAQFILLLLPVVMSLMLLKKTLPKHKVLLHLPLHIATGLTLAALSLPLLDSTIQEKVFASYYGNLLRESQDLLVGAAAVLALVITWLTYRHKEDKRHSKRK